MDIRAIGYPARWSEIDLRATQATQAVLRWLESIWQLLLILGLQAGIALTMLNNSAFQDEGLYLYAGRQIVRFWRGGPVPLDRYAFYFSGYPQVYPPVGGLLDLIGGLELARAFSLACMLGVTVIVYRCTLRIFDRRSAIFASALYGSLAPVLFLSRLATYDPMCLLLIVLGVDLALSSSSSRFSWTAVLIGPVMVYAILAKYVALIFVPSVFGILFFGALAYMGWKAAISRTLAALGALGVSLVVAYVLMDKLALHAIVGSTTDRMVSNLAPRSELLWHTLQLGGVVYLAATVGLVVALIYHRRLRLLALIMYFSSWLTPAYHIYKQEFISSEKHIAYGLFFAMPLAGFALVWLATQARRLQVTHLAERFAATPFAVVLIVLLLGIQQSQVMFSEWANTNDLTYVLHTQMRDGSGRYFIEDIEVARYDARDVTESWQWYSVQYFNYTYYTTRDHRHLFGEQAMAQAVSDGYFAIIELSFVYQPSQAYFIAHQMAASRNYDLIARVPFHNVWGTGHFSIFRNALSPGHGNFTDINQAGP